MVLTKIYGDNIMEQTYSFDDVLLVPQYSRIESRSEIDIASMLDSKSKFELHPH